jgi:hypothetical protein
VAACYGREIERAEAKAEALRREMLPNMTDQLVSAWEVLTGIVVTTPDMTIEQRREAIMARIRQIYSAGSGDDWVQAVDTLLAGQWTYEEHLPYANLLTNPAVNADVTSWAGAASTTLGHSTARAHSGGGSATVARAAASGTGVAGMRQTRSGLNPAGKSYAAAARFQSQGPTARNGEVRLEFYNGSGGLVGSAMSGQVTAPVGGWSVASTASFIAPVGANPDEAATDVVVEARIASTPVGETHNIDSLMLVEGELPPAITFVDNPKQDPPAYTIRVAVPFPPTSTRYQQLVELVKGLRWSPDDPARQHRRCAPRGRQCSTRRCQQLRCAHPGR